MKYCKTSVSIGLVKTTLWNGNRAGEVKVTVHLYLKRKRFPDNSALNGVLNDMPTHVPVLAHTYFLKF